MEQVVVNIKTEALQKKVEPSSSKFWFIPVINPHLRAFVDSVNWNSMLRTLDVRIRETALGTAFKWFSSINSAKSTPVEEDAIVLVVLDTEEVELFRYKFSDLTLQNHSCRWVSFPDNTLTHEIEIKYEKMERVESNNCYEYSPTTHNDVDAIFPYRVVDEEWLLDKDYKVDDGSEPVVKSEESDITENT